MGTCGGRCCHSKKKTYGDVGRSVETQPFVPFVPQQTAPTSDLSVHDTRETARCMRTSEEEVRGRVTDAVVEGQPQLTVTIRKSSEHPLGIVWSFGDPQKLAGVGAVLGGSAADRHGLNYLRGWLLAAAEGTAVERDEVEALGHGKSEVTLTLLAPPPDSPALTWPNSSRDSTESVVLLVGDCVLVRERLAWIADLTPTGVPEVRYADGEREWLVGEMGTTVTTGRSSCNFSPSRTTPLRSLSPSSPFEIESVTWQQEASSSPVAVLLSSRPSSPGGVRQSVPTLKLKSAVSRPGGGNVPVFVLEEFPQGKWRARHADTYPSSAQPPIMPLVSGGVLPPPGVDLLEEASSNAFSPRSGPFPSPQFSPEADVAFPMVIT